MRKIAIIIIIQLLPVYVNVIRQENVELYNELLILFFNQECGRAGPGLSNVGGCARQFQACVSPAATVLSTVLEQSGKHSKHIFFS